MDHQIVPALSPASLCKESHFVDINDTSFDDILTYYENKPVALNKEHLLQELSENEDLSLWKWRLRPNRDDLVSRMDNLGINIHDIIPCMKVLHEDYNTACMTAREFYEWNIFFMLFKFRFEKHGKYVMLDRMRRKIKMFPGKIGCIITSTILAISYSEIKTMFDCLSNPEKYTCLNYMAENTMNAAYFLTLCEYDTNVDTNEKNKLIQIWFSNIIVKCNNNIQEVKNLTHYDWKNITVHPYIKQEIELMELRSEIIEHSSILSGLEDRYAFLVKNKLTYH
jgi:hypothetical protein